MTYYSAGKRGLLKQTDVTTTNIGGVLKVKNEDEELVKICEAQEEKVTSKKEKEEAKKKKDNILGERWGLMKWMDR